MNFHRMLCTLALGSVLSMGASAQAPTGGEPKLPKGFQEPLVTPAPQFPGVTKEMMMSVAQAGKRLVAVGAWGGIILSDDDGKTWRQAESPVSSNLLAVYFLDAKLGWIAGHDGVVLHSEDGGNTWVKQFDGRQAADAMIRQYEATASTDATARIALDEARRSITENGPAYPFLNIWFRNASEGYIVGAFSFIFKTTNGGKTWVPLFDKVENPNVLHLNAVGSVGDATYLTGEKGMVLKLDTSKDRFLPVSPDYAGSFFGMVTKPTVLLVYGLRGNAFRTLDGGKTWQKSQVGESTTFTGGTALTDGRIVLVSQSGRLWISADDGATFTEKKSAKPLPRFAVAVTADGKSLATASVFGVIVEPLN